MQGTRPSRADAPAALVMAALFLTFGVFAIWRPDKLRSAMDSFAGGRKEGSWHSYRMPLRSCDWLSGGLELGVQPCSFTSHTSRSVDNCRNIAISLVERGWALGLLSVEHPTVDDDG